MALSTSNPFLTSPTGASVLLNPPPQSFLSSNGLSTARFNAGFLHPANALAASSVSGASLAAPSLPEASWEEQTLACLARGFEALSRTFWGSNTRAIVLMVLAGVLTTAYSHASFNVAVNPSLVRPATLAASLPLVQQDLDLDKPLGDYTLNELQQKAQAAVYQTLQEAPSPLVQKALLEGPSTRLKADPLQTKPVVAETHSPVKATAPKAAERLQVAAASKPAVKAPLNTASTQPQFKPTSSLASKASLRSASTRLGAPVWQSFMVNPGGLQFSIPKMLQFKTPVQGRMTSGFGRRWGRAHQGLDYAAPYGTPIQASEAGTVSFAGWQSGYGRVVVINHGNGYESRYAHCSKLLVKKGQVLQQGQTIAKVGSTGHSTGPHLHFEIRHLEGKRKVAKNPITFLKQPLLLATSSSNSLATG